MDERNMLIASKQARNIEINLSKIQESEKKNNIKIYMIEIRIT